MKKYTKFIMISVIVILLIIMVLILIKCKESYQSVRENLKGYRLGDMIKANIFRQQDDGFNLHQSKYPKSIATKYMKAVKSLSEDDQNNNLTVLTNILDNSEYSKYKNTKNNIIIHIRTGDVIDNQPYSVDEFLEKERKFQPDNKHNYVKPLSYYQDVVKKLKTMKLPKKIEIITGFHTEHDHKKSLQYIDRVKKYFKSQGYQVSTRINKHPDHDFVYMSSCKYFIPSGGGFSLLVGNMVNHNGNTVIKV